LPEGVGALVEKLEAVRTVVRLVNLNPNEERKLIIQAGAFGEHRFGTAKYFARTSEWPGELGGYAGSYAPPRLTTETRTETINSEHLHVELPPGTELVLDLTTDRFVHTPSYSTPW
jgi:hypothetical protein